MAKRGRPRKVNKAQNRIVSVVLNEKATLLFRKIKKNSDYGGKFIHRFVSEELIKRFGKEYEEELILEELNLLQTEREKLIEEYNIKIKLKAQELKKAQDNIYKKKLEELK